MERKSGMEISNYSKNYRETPRNEEDVKALVSRVNRVKGQIDGVRTMLEENRYCGDILIQLSAAESAIRSLSYLIFEEHLSTCVAEKLRQNDPEIVKETVELIKRLK